MFDFNITAIIIVHANIHQIKNMTATDKLPFTRPTKLYIKPIFKKIIYLKQLWMQE